MKKSIKIVTLLTLFAAMLVFINFKAGYSGIWPFVEDIPAVHEHVTTEAVRYFCEENGLEAVKNSPLYQGLFELPFDSYNDFNFSMDMGEWVDNLNHSPMKGIVIGSRIPDMWEMCGVDSQKGDYTIVKYDPNVQFDAYRQFPMWISSYRNVYGADMELCIRVFREYLKETYYEAVSLILSYDVGQDYINQVLAANSMSQHDTNTSKQNLNFDVNWNSVMLGAALHYIADSYSHSPLVVLDPENNKLITTGLFYGQFTDQNNNLVENKDIYNEISPEFEDTMGVTKWHLLYQRVYSNTWI